MPHVIPHLSFHTCHSEMGYLDGHSRNLFRSLDCPTPLVRRGPLSLPGCRLTPRWQDDMKDCLTPFVRRGSFHYPDVALCAGWQDDMNDCPS